MSVAEVISIVDDCLNFGQFGSKKVVHRCKVLVTCGVLLKDLIGLDKKPNPVLQKLAELDSKLDQLSRKMDSLLNDLKAHMSAFHFYADVALTASTLTRFLKDVFSTQSDISYNIFREKCKKYAPLDKCYEFIELLKQEVTNPLKTAMTSDKLKKTATFDKWRNIIDGVLSQLLFLECFINGLYWNSDMYGPNRMRDIIVEVNEDMDRWRSEYMDSYWPKTVQQLMEDTQDNHSDVGNDPKAVIIKEALMSILTNDVFYVLVYDHCGGWDKHSFTGDGNQYLTSFRRKGCNVVVYRSRRWRYDHNEAYDQIVREVESCRNGVIPRIGDYQGFPGTLMNGQINNVRFVGMIRADLTVAVRSANSFGRESGPGWWITANVPDFYRCGRISNFHHHVCHPGFVVIAGYK